MEKLQGIDVQRPIGREFWPYAETNANRHQSLPASDEDKFIIRAGASSPKFGVFSNALEFGLK
jgi:hypothetical protein